MDLGSIKGTNKGWEASRPERAKGEHRGPKPKKILGRCCLHTDSDSSQTVAPKAVASALPGNSLDRNFSVPTADLQNQKLWGRASAICVGTAFRMILIHNKVRQPLLYTSDQWLANYSQWATPGLLPVLL